MLMSFFPFIFACGFHRFTAGVVNLLHSPVVVELAMLREHTGRKRRGVKVSENEEGTMTRYDHERSETRTKREST